MCGLESCTTHPDTDHLKTYPFLTGGRDPLAGQLAGRDFVFAPHAIYDRTAGVERCVYGVGDPVPMADAVRYGLVAGPDPDPPDPEPRKGKRARKGPAATRHHPGPTEDRSA